MDFGKAAFLVAAAYGNIELAKAALEAFDRKDWKVLRLIGVVLGVAFGLVFLVRYTAWAHSQVIGDRPLDELGTASLILVSLLLAGVEAAAFKIVTLGATAVGNVGGTTTVHVAPPPSPPAGPDADLEP